MSEILEPYNSESNSESGAENGPQVQPKRYRGGGTLWEFLRSLTSFQDARQFLLDQHQLKLRTSHTTSTGVKMYYNYKDSRKCGARVYLHLLDDEGTVNLYKAEGSHHHEPKTTGICAGKL